MTKKKLCKSCANKTVLSAQILTPFLCGLCDMKYVNPDTDIPKYCNICARKLKVCYRCGEKLKEK